MRVRLPTAWVMTLLRWPLLGAVVAAVLLGFAVLSTDREPEAPPTRPVVSSFWSVQVTGGRPTLLFRDRGQDHFPTYRRGRAILFARASFASTALFSATPGSPPQRLRRLPVLAQFAYSPATDEIVVERESAIVAESLTRGDSRVLARVHGEANGTVLSADGTTLVFGRQVSTGNGYQPELVIVRGGHKKVFRLPASSPGPLAIAPHGDRLLFRWGRQLFLLDTHTGRRRLFANGDSYAAAWSPDGRTIAYFDKGGLVTRDLITNRKRLLVPSPVSISGVSFSPDGRTLVYATLKAN